MTSSTRPFIYYVPLAGRDRSRLLAAGLRHCGVRSETAARSISLHPLARNKRRRLARRLDLRTSSCPDYAVSQRMRKRVEVSFRRRCREKGRRGPGCQERMLHLESEALPPFQASIIGLTGLDLKFALLCLTEPRAHLSAYVHAFRCNQSAHDHRRLVTSDSSAAMFCEQSQSVLCRTKRVQTQVEPFVSGEPRVRDRPRTNIQRPIY
jgi:hypothetical protein